MSAPKRISPTAVVDALFNDPHGFEFVQAVRVLERWLALAEGREGRDVLDRRLYFRNSLELSFPPSQIQSLHAMRAPERDEAETARLRSKGAASLQAILAAHEEEHWVPSQQQNTRQIGRIEMVPAFMSLLGASGALPIVYTEVLARHAMLQRDRSPSEFLDIFLHRMVILFYEAWRKYRPVLSFDQMDRQPLLAFVLAFVGLGQVSLRNRLGARQGGVSDQTIGFFSGLMQQKPVSALAIQQILSSYFAVQVEVQQFVGRWFRLERQSQTSLGMRNAVLGQGACSGERVWQRDLRVRLVLGPMSREQYQRFLPGGPAAFALKHLLTQLTGILIEYEIRLCLRREDVLPSQLGQTSPSLKGAGAHHPRATVDSASATPLPPSHEPAEASVPEGVHLGWDSFLLSGPSDRDRSDAGYLIHAHT